MIHTSQTVRLVNHCFTTRTSRMSRGLVYTQKVSLMIMIYTSPTVRLLNHCFTTSTTCTNRTGRAKRNMPLYGSYQFMYIGQPSSHDLKTMFHKIFSFCLIACCCFWIKFQVPSYDLKAAKLSWQCPFMPFDILLTYSMTFPLNWNKTFL